MVQLCKEIVIFLVLAKIMEGFCQGNKYGKFMKLMISLVVLLKLITPIISLFDESIELTKTIERIENRIFIEEILEENPPVFHEQIEKISVEDVEILVEDISWEK